MERIRRNIVSTYKIWRARMKPLMKETRLSLYILGRSPIALTGLVIIAIFFFIAVFGDMIAPYNPYTIDLEIRFQPPSYEHLFGTDEFGRDIFSRVLSGAKYSIQTGIAVLAMAVPFGSVLGAAAGYFGGKYDEITMRVTDMFLAFPGLILAMAVAAALGPSLQNTMLALAIVWWPLYTRLVRGQALSVRENAYIEAAKSMGASHPRIILRHILPNCISPVIVAITMDMGMVIIWASGLSFLGFGAQPPSPEWGRMITEGRIYIFRAWWYTAFPGLAILLVVLGFNLFGDAIRDILDPRLRRIIEVRRE